MNYIEQFLLQTEKTPNAIAVTDDKRAITYSELKSVSGSLSAFFHQITSQGLKANGQWSIGVLLPRTVDIVVGAIATMRAGGVYMPMDLEYPTERLQFMLKDSSASILLTTKELWKEKQLVFPESQVVFIDEFQIGNQCFDADIALDASSFLLYTSGTTGRPKGVLHTHKSLQAMAQQWDGFDSTGVVAGFTFIASAFMMFPPLIMGGTCHIVPEAAKLDMYALQTYVEQHHIHQLFLPASLAASMVEEFPLDEVTIFSAGEKLRNFKPKGHCCVMNAYGSTEGVVVLAAKAAGDEMDIPLGSPCKGITARIVDESLHDVQPTTSESMPIGELIYTGDIMAERYLSLDEQTAAKWIWLDGKRWYRTGDRVKIDSDGMYHYVGRSDNMVKIRGFRVETGEVENCIRTADPAITDAVVVLRCLHGIDYLCCYYTATSSVNVDALKERIGQRLASYMLPDFWVALNEFPRNPNGKIMRNALPEPQQHLEALSALYSEVELIVEESARMVLGLDSPIDIDESFIHLGGDSLRALKLSTMLAEHGIRITGSDILRLKVLRLIAQEAEVAYERLWSPEQYAQVKYRFAQWGEKIQKVLPLTSGQDDMLYSELIFPDCSDNRTVYVLAIDSTIHYEELASAVANTCSLNEELRAAIVYQGVSVFQQVITDRIIPSSCVDLTDNKDALSEIATICDRMKRAPVDLEQSPAMEVVFAQTDRGGCLLVKVLQVSLGLDGTRKGILGILNQLVEKHPDDQSMKDWIDILSMAVEEDSKLLTGPSKTSQLLGKLNGSHEDVAVYSDHPDKKKVFFVHTGNTGSDAYYKLADKIGEDCSFMVIEPYNLYHPNDVIDGIKNIAAQYVKIVRKYQSEGPYFLGGWCYGGVVAHEMACQLEAAGEKVEHLIMLDSHAVVDPVAKRLFNSMSSFNKREYFETSPLFADLRAQGLLESVVMNSKRVARDLALHEPSVFGGKVTYFKPQVTPSGISGESLQYWQEMMRHKAGGYEHFCKDIEVIPTPHEHDLMMDDESLAIIVPQLKRYLDETEE